MTACTSGTTEDTVRTAAPYRPSARALRERRHKRHVHCVIASYEDKAEIQKRDHSDHKEGATFGRENPE